MIKVEKEAGIHIRDALKKLGAGFNTTAQIRSTAERIRGKKIEYNIVIDFLFNYVLTEYYSMSQYLAKARRAHIEMDLRMINGMLLISNLL